MTGPAGPAGEPGYRLYGDLAPWWPLISPPAQYRDEAARLAAVLRAAAGGGPLTVLDLGCGGGHLAAHLKAAMTMTLVDLSPQMLAVSRVLNPDCEHHRGDMRTIRLGRLFDAVLVHDAVDYMITEPDLGAVIATAYAHCRPGGLAVFAPDYTAETFRPGAGAGGGSDQAGRQASFRSWSADPDPADHWIQADYEFTLRCADGRTEVVRESHRLAAFRAADWRRLLAAAGFAAGQRRRAGAEQGGPAAAPLFTGRRPG